MNDRDHELLTVKETAQYLRCSDTTLWDGVKSGRFPAPVYAAKRAPRWWKHELRDALNATRPMPAVSDAKQAPDERSKT